MITRKIHTYLYVIINIDQSIIYEVNIFYTQMTLWITIYAKSMPSLASDCTLMLDSILSCILALLDVALYPPPTASSSSFQNFIHV